MRVSLPHVCDLSNNNYCAQHYIMLSELYYSSSHLAARLSTIVCRGFLCLVSLSSFQQQPVSGVSQSQYVQGHVKMSMNISRDLALLGDEADSLESVPSWTVIALGIVNTVLMFATLWTLFDKPGLNDGKLWPIFIPEHHSMRTSKHPFDPYSISHAAHGAFGFIVTLLSGKHKYEIRKLINSLTWSESNVSHNASPAG